MMPFVFTIKIKSGRQNRVEKIAKKKKKSKNWKKNIHEKEKDVCLWLLNAGCLSLHKVNCEQLKIINYNLMFIL